MAVPKGVYRKYESAKALYERGSTQGERDAARAAMDRLEQKYPDLRPQSSPYPVSTKVSFSRQHNKEEGHEWWRPKRGQRWEDTRGAKKSKQENRKKAEEWAQKRRRVEMKAKKGGPSYWKRVYGVEHSEWVASMDGPNNSGDFTNGWSGSMSEDWG